jgi:outer membrane lipoprotein-sorting protein
MIGKSGASLDSAKIGGHIPRMRTLLAAAATLLTLVFAATGSAHAQANLQDVERYFNSIRTLQARFVQTNPNGSVVQGTLYVRRPGPCASSTTPPRSSRSWPTAAR